MKTQHFNIQSEVTQNLLVGGGDEWIKNPNLCNNNKKNTIMLKVMKLPNGQNRTKCDTIL